VKRCRALTLPLLCVFLLSGCWNGRALFFFEQPFWSTLGDDARIRVTLMSASLRRGYFPRIDIAAPGGDSQAGLVKDAGKGAYSTVVVGPLLSSEWKSYVPRISGARFILVDVSPPAADPPPNVLFLTFDRREAFHAAGFAAAASALEGHGGDGATDPGQRIGLLLSNGTELSPDEIDAFNAGVAESLNGARPVTRLLSAPIDKASVKTAVQEMQRQGTEIFLLGLGSVDPLGLEVMKDTGGCAVVADWAASGAYPAQVFLSVEEDVPGGLLRALAALRTDTRSVSGPVRLVAGKARPLPSAVRGHVDGDRGS